MAGEAGAARAPTSHFNGVVGLTVARLVNGALALLGRALLARLLPAAGLGAVVLATTMSAVVVRALSGGLGQAAQFMPGAAPSRTLGMSLALACLPVALLFGALALWGGPWLAAQLLPNNAAAARIFSLLLYTAPCIFIAFVISLYAVGQRRYLAASVLAVVPVLVPSAGYALLLAGAGGGALVVPLLVAANVLSALAGLAFALARWRPARPALPEVRAIYGYGLRASAVSTFAYFVNNVVVLLGGYYADSRSIGLYAVAAVYGELLTQVYGPVSMVLMSRTAGAEDERDRHATLARVCRVCFSLLAPLGLLLGLASIPVTALLFGAGYHDAPLVVLLMLPGVVLSGQQRLLENYLYGINRQQWVFVGYAVHLLACLLGMPLLVRGAGVAGLPLSFSLASACSLGVLLVLARTRLGLPAARMWFSSGAELRDVGRRLARLAGRRPQGIATGGER